MVSHNLQAFNVRPNKAVIYGQAVAYGLPCSRMLHSSLSLWSWLSRWLLPFIFDLNILHYLPKVVIKIFSDLSKLSDSFNLMWSRPLASQLNLTGKSFTLELYNHTRCPTSYGLFLQLSIMNLFVSFCPCMHKRIHKLHLKAHPSCIDATFFLYMHTHNCWHLIWFVTIWLKILIRFWFVIILTWFSFMKQLMIKTFHLKMNHPP